MTLKEKVSEALTKGDDLGLDELETITGAARPTLRRTCAQGAKDGLWLYENDTVSRTAKPEARRAIAQERFGVAGIVIASAPNVWRTPIIGGTCVDCGRIQRPSRRDHRVCYWFRTKRNRANRPSR